MGCDQPHQQAGRGAAVAHVERLARLEQATDADAVDRPGAVAGPVYARPPRPHRGGGGEDVMAFEPPGDAARSARSSEERRVGKGWVSTVRSRWSPDNSKKKKHNSHIQNQH